MAVALGGCGQQGDSTGSAATGGSEEAAVSAVVMQAAELVATHGADGLCDLIYKEEIPGPDEAQQAVCLDAMERELASQTGEERAAAETLEIVDVTIAGDEATVDVRTADDSEAVDLELRRVSGDWQLYTLGVLE
jgi:hypothetical protein